MNQVVQVESGSFLMLQVERVAMLKKKEKKKLKKLNKKSTFGKKKERKFIIHIAKIHSDSQQR